jgi:hypothetical protein
MGNYKLLFLCLSMTLAFLMQNCTERSLNLTEQNSNSSTVNQVPKTCLEILNAQRASGSNTYQIDPDGSGGRPPIDVYCDMQTDGGGWTLVRKADGSPNAALTVESEVNITALSSNLANANAQMSSDAANLIGSQMMVLNTDTSVRLWYDRARSKNAEPDCNTSIGNKPFRWVYEPTGPIIYYCERAASVYLPSENRWGQDVGRPGVLLNVVGGSFNHGLCFGSQIPNTSGHFCLYRTNGTSGFMWWNYGSGAAGTGGNENSYPKVLIYVR